MKSTIKFFLITSIGTITCGCTILLPAHTSSNKRTGEKVSLKTISCDLAKKDNYFITKYQNAFPGKTIENSCNDIFVPTKRHGNCVNEKNENPIKSDTQLFMLDPITGMAASAAIGLATDFVKKKLEEEKELYTAQYTGRLVDDQFWKSITFTENKEIDCLYEEKDGNNNTLILPGKQKSDGYTLKPNYIGFEFTRTIENQDKPASKVLYGLTLSSDNHFFQIKPLSFEMNYAKAKVLSDQWGTWIFPPTLLMKLFKVTDNTVDIELDLNIDAYWTQLGKDFGGPKTIAAFKTNISGYDLSNPTALDTSKLGNDSGWLLVPPISDSINLYNGNSGGNFKVTIKATERDTSEAKKIIDLSEEWVSKGSDKLKAVIEQE